MSALVELRGGIIGPEFLLLLRRTIRAVATSRNIPPPEDRSIWDDESVDRVVSEFVADGRTPRRLTDLATACQTEDGLRARLQGTVRNFLADLGRRTPIGKLVRRINSVLIGDPRFVRVAGRWALADGPVDPAGADEDALDRAIRGHAVVVPAWGHDAHRAAPVADAETISGLCKTLIETAGGSLPTRILATVIGRRIGIGQAPLSLEIDGLDGGWHTPMAPLDATADAALRSVRAHEVLELLSDRERLAIAYAEYTVRELGPLLGVRHSQAQSIRQRAVETLKIELLEDVDGEGVAMQVIELARRWAEEWTQPADPTL
jgi:hypothetical protein